MSLSVQFFSLLAMIGTGIIAAALIDLVGTGIAHGRRYAFFRKYPIGIEVVGWILAGCWAFYILYHIRDGAWRIYDPFAQFSGLLLYISFFHRPFRLIGRVVLVLIIKPVWFVFWGLFSVLKYIVMLIIHFISFLSSPFVVIFRKLFRKSFQSKVK